MEISAKANHFAKVACMVKDHIKTADLDPTVTGGLVGAGLGGLGNMAIRSFLERNKKVKPTSTLNNFLLGAGAGGALGAGGTYLYNHGLAPNMSKTVTAPSGNVATLGQIDSAANNANAVEGSQFNRLKNLVLGGGEGSEPNDLAHTAKNTALGAGVLSATPGRHNLIAAVRRALRPGEKEITNNLTGDGSFKFPAMQSSGKFSLGQGPSEDALSQAYFNKLKNSNTVGMPNGTVMQNPVTVLKGKGGAVAPSGANDFALSGGRDYAKLDLGSPEQKSMLNAYIKDPVNTPTSAMPKLRDLDRASAGRNLTTGLTKSVAIGQGARLGNNLLETLRLLQNR